MVSDFLEALRNKPSPMQIGSVPCWKDAVQEGQEKQRFSQCRMCSAICPRGILRIFLLMLPSWYV